MSAASPQDRLRAATLQAHRKRIGRVAQHLREQLDEPIDSAAVTKLACLSLRQLERIFERTVGESPVAYVRRLRLERAAACLRTARATILTIALEAGFESHAAFTRAFRKRFGETPTAYRSLAKATFQPRARMQLWRQIASSLRRHIEL